MNSSTSDQTAVVVLGKGGIWKTCALEEIRRRAQEDKQNFKDGVLHVSIGQGVGVLDLIVNLSELVKRSGGGEKLVQDIQDAKIHLLPFH